jgi:phenylacetate-CoA ligase
VQEGADRNAVFLIVVELAPNVTASQEKQEAIAIVILQQLKRLNSEFANYVPPSYQLPQIVLKATGDPEHFPPGVKHRWVAKP